MARINEPQDLFLHLIGMSGRWNNFDGPAIETALRNNRAWWRSVVFARSASVAIKDVPLRLKNKIDLIVLRDLPEGHVNLDSVFILAEPGFQDQLEAVVRSWRSDEVNWLDQREAFHAMSAAAAKNRDWDADQKRVILRAWWD